MKLIFFFDFTFNTCTFQLSKNGQSVSLRPKTAALLNLFLQHPEQLLSKQTIYQQIWPSVQVQDHVLFQVISEIRKIAPEQELIRTQPNAGYVWVAPLLSGERQKRSAAIYQAACVGLLCGVLSLATWPSKPTDNLTVLPAMSAYNKGVVALAEGHAVEAVDYFEFSLSQNPHSIESSLMLAESLFQANQIQRAKEQLMALTYQYTVNDYTQLEISNLLSRIHQSQGQMDQALDSILQGLEEQELIAQCTAESLELQLSKLEPILTQGHLPSIEDITMELRRKVEDKSHLVADSSKPGEPSIDCAELISADVPINSEMCVEPESLIVSREHELTVALRRESLV